MKVRDAVRLIEQDGWFLVATRGSYRQYKHPTKPGRDNRRQTIGRHGGRHIEQRAQADPTERSKVMRYAVVIEKVDGNYSAYVPDLPGCVATGATVSEVELGNP